MKEGKKPGSKAGMYFLVIVVIIYLILSVFNANLAFSALSASTVVLARIIPAIMAVFVIMALTNYYISPKKLAKYMGRGSGISGILIAIVAGILSTGPIYVWYPMLKELRERGVRDALISIFLYNRAIKIALIPMIVLYFGLKYMIILTVAMIIVSVLQGFLTERLSARSSGQRMKG